MRIPFILLDVIQNLQIPMPTSSIPSSTDQLLHSTSLTSSELMCNLIVVQHMMYQTVISIVVLYSMQGFTLTMQNFHTVSHENLHTYVFLHAHKRLIIIDGQHNFYE